MAVSYILCVHLGLMQHATPPGKGYMPIPLYSTGYTTCHSQSTWLGPPSRKMMDVFKKLMIPTAY